jgi:hypothetical protein
MEFDIYMRALKSEDAVFINNLRKDQKMEEKLGPGTGSKMGAGPDLQR